MKKKPFPKESVVKIVARREARQKTYDELARVVRDAEEKIDGHKKTDS